VPPVREGVERIELYINSNWTERYGNAYVAEAGVWSKNGDHPTIYGVDPIAEEADAKLMGALREPKLRPETSIKA
jgi:hypothetical protein